MNNTASFIAKQIDNIVPIIGFDMCMHKNETLQSYIVNRLCDDKLGNKPIVTESIDIGLRQRMQNEGYHGFSMLYKRILKKWQGEYPDGNSQILAYISQIVEEEKNNIHLRDNVIEYLKEAHPCLILTTIPFDIIEKELEQELNHKYEARYFVANRDNDSDTKIIPSSEIPPFCIFHLFGTTTESASPWVWTERHLLLYLHALHNQELSQFSIKKALLGKSFFVLGCNLPEWLFQFLLFPLKGSSSAKGSYWINNEKNDRIKEDDQMDETFEQLSEKLETYDCEVEQYTFLRDITTSIRSLKESQKNIIKKEPEYYDFFISHRKGDEKITAEIINEIRKCKCEVWVDYEHPEHLAGDQWTNIRHIIEKSRHIIPIITWEYLTRFSQDNEPERCGVANLTKMALSFMYPCDSEGKKSLRADAAKFVIPIINEGEPLTVFNDQLGSESTAYLGIRTYHKFVKNKQLPEDFENLHVYHYGGKDDENSITKTETWRDLAEDGKTMKELGYKL